MEIKEKNNNFAELLKRVLRDGGESADIFHEKREDIRISLSNESAVLPAFGSSEGMALRLFKSSFCGSVHMEFPEEDELIRAADILVDSSRTQSGLLSIQDNAIRKPVKALSQNKGKRKVEHQFCGEASKSMFDKGMMNISSKIEEIGHLLREYSQNKLLFSINASIYRQNVHVCDSTEKDVKDVREGAFIRIKTSNSNDSPNISSDMNLEYSHVEDLMEKLDPDKTVKDFFQRYFARQESVKAPNGEMPLVLACGAGGVFIHEVVGHLFEGDNPLLPSLNEELKNFRLKKSVSIIDDPSLMARGRYLFDDEGIKGRKKALIQSGKWAGLLHSYRTAKRIGSIPEGNGRRQSFRDIPLPRTSAIYMEKGEMLAEDILKSVKFGIFASAFGDSVLEEACGDFSIYVTEGNIIRDGRIGEPISGAIILGNSFEVLKSIDLVANDLQFDKTGLSCSKFGQTIPSSVGTPTMRIALARVVPQ